MRSIVEKIIKTAEAEDVTAYYAAVYEYSAVGLSASDNPILRQIIIDLLPAMRRIHYVSLIRQTRCLRENAEYFRRLTECMNNRDAGGGGNVMRDYMLNEKETALEAIRKQSF